MSKSNSGSINKIGSSPLLPLLVLGAMVASLIVGSQAVKNVRTNFDNRSRAQTLLVGATCTAAGGKCVSKETKNLGTGGCIVLTQYDDCGGTETGLTCVPRRNTTCQAPDNRCLSSSNRSISFCGVNTSTNTDVCGSGLCSFVNGQPIANIGSSLPPGQSNPYPGQLCINSGGVCVSKDTALISCSQRVNSEYDDCNLAVGNVSTRGSVVNVAYANAIANLICVKPESCTNTSSRVCEDNYPSSGGAAVKLACGVSGFVGTSTQKLTCIDSSQYSCILTDGSYGCSNNPCDPKYYWGKNIVKTPEYTPPASFTKPGTLCAKNGGQCLAEGSSGTPGYRLAEYDADCNRSIAANGTSFGQSFPKLICAAAYNPPAGKCADDRSKIYCGKGPGDASDVCCTKTLDSCTFQENKTLLSDQSKYSCTKRTDLIGGIACLGQSIYRNDSRNPSKGAQGGYVIDSQNLLAGDVHVVPGTVLIFQLVRGPIEQATSDIVYSYPLNQNLEFWDADIGCEYDSLTHKVTCNSGPGEVGGPTSAVIRAKVKDALPVTTFLSQASIATGNVVSNCFNRNITIDTCTTPNSCTTQTECSTAGGTAIPNACTTTGSVCCKPKTTAGANCTAAGGTCVPKDNLCATTLVDSNDCGTDKICGKTCVPPSLGWRKDTTDACIQCSASLPESLLQTCVYRTQNDCNLSKYGWRIAQGQCFKCNEFTSESLLQTCVYTDQVACLNALKTPAESSCTVNPGFACVRSDRLCLETKTFSATDNGKCALNYQCGKSCAFTTPPPLLNSGDLCVNKTPPLNYDPRYDTTKYCAYCPVGYQEVNGLTQCKQVPSNVGPTINLNDVCFGSIFDTCTCFNRQIKPGDVCKPAFSVPGSRVKILEGSNFETMICDKDGRCNWVDRKLSNDWAKGSFKYALWSNLTLVRSSTGFLQRIYSEMKDAREIKDKGGFFAIVPTEDLFFNKLRICFFIPSQCELHDSSVSKFYEKLFALYTYPPTHPTNDVVPIGVVADLILNSDPSLNTHERNALAAAFVNENLTPFDVLDAYIQTAKTVEQINTNISNYIERAKVVVPDLAADLNCHMNPLAKIAKCQVKRSIFEDLAALTYLYLDTVFTGLSGGVSSQEEVVKTSVECTKNFASVYEDASAQCVKAFFEVLPLLTGPGMEWWAKPAAQGLARWGVAGTAGKVHTYIAASIDRSLIAKGLKVIRVGTQGITWNAKNVIMKLTTQLSGDTVNVAFEVNGQVINSTIAKSAYGSFFYVPEETGMIRIIDEFEQAILKDFITENDVRFYWQKRLATTATGFKNLWSKVLSWEDELVKMASVLDTSPQNPVNEAMRSLLNIAKVRQAGTLDEFKNWVSEVMDGLNTALVRGARPMGKDATLFWKEEVGRVGSYVTKGVNRVFVQSRASINKELHMSFFDFLRTYNVQSPAKFIAGQTDVTYLSKYINFHSSQWSKVISTLSESSGEAINRFVDYTFMVVDRTGSGKIYQISNYQNLIATGQYEAAIKAKLLASPNALLSKAQVDTLKASAQTGNQLIGQDIVVSGINTNILNSIDDVFYHQQLSLNEIGNFLLDKSTVPHIGVGPRGMIKIGWGVDGNGNLVKVAVSDNYIHARMDGLFAVDNVSKPVANRFANFAGPLETIQPTISANGRRVFTPLLSGADFNAVRTKVQQELVPALRNAYIAKGYSAAEAGKMATDLSGPDNILGRAIQNHIYAGDSSKITHTLHVYIDPQNVKSIVPYYIPTGNTVAPFEAYTYMSGQRQLISIGKGDVAVMAQATGTWIRNALRNYAGKLTYEQGQKALFPNIVLSRLESGGIRNIAFGTVQSSSYKLTDDVVLIAFVSGKRVSGVYEASDTLIALIEIGNGVPAEVASRARDLFTRPGQLKLVVEDQIAKDVAALNAAR